MLYLMYGQFIKFGYTDKNRSVATVRRNAYEFHHFGVSNSSICKYRSPIFKNKKV